MISQISINIPYIVIFTFYFRNWIGYSLVTIICYCTAALQSKPSDSNRPLSDGFQYRCHIRPIYNRRITWVLWLERNSVDSGRTYDAHHTPRTYLLVSCWPTRNHSSKELLFRGTFNIFNIECIYQESAGFQFAKESYISCVLLCIYVTEVLPVFFYKPFPQFWCLWRIFLGTGSISDFCDIIQQHCLPIYGCIYCQYQVD